MKLKKMQGARLTTSYFVTYFVILVIPIIIACFFYSESIHIIHGDIEKENRTLLSQASQTLDARLQELNHIGDQIINNSQIMSLRYVDSPLEYPNIQYYFNVQNTLPDYSSFNDFLFDYVLFFNQGSLAINNKVAYDYDDFYELFMHPAGQSRDEWLKDLRNTPISFGSCTLRDMVYLLGDTPVTKKLIAFNYSFLPFNNGDGQAVLYVDQQSLVGLLSAFGLEEDGIAFIETRRGELLAANTQDESAVLKLQKMPDTGSSGKESFNTLVGGKEHLVSAFRSEQTGMRITIARPTATLYARVRSLRNIIVFTMLAVLALGTLVSYIFSRRNSVFLRSLAANSNLARMSYSEAFRSLHQTFGDIQTDNSRLSQTLAQQRPYLLESLMSQLIRGVFISEEEAQTAARSVGASCAGQPTCAVLFHFTGTGRDATDNQLSANCKAVIRLSIKAREVEALHMNRSEGNYAMLLSGSRLDVRVKSLVQMIRSNLPADINEMLFVYVGNTVERLTDVVRSWDNASSMIYIRPSPTEFPVLTYTEGENAKAGIFYPQDIQRRLVDSVMNGDEREVRNLLAQLKERNLQGFAQHGYMRRLFIDSLLNTLVQTSTIADLPPEKAQSIRNEVNNLMALPIDEQLMHLDTVFISLCHATQQAKSSKPKMIDDIMAYIQEHYLDPELSLTVVADYFHISESYLSYTFKAVSGVNFFNCVEMMRMDKAKELLRQTDAKISDIANQVGYASTNSFCRAFKRTTGNSATAYRNGMD